MTQRRYPADLPGGGPVAQQPPGGADPDIASGVRGYAPGRDVGQGGRGDTRGAVGGMELVDPIAGGYVDGVVGSGAKVIDEVGAQAALLRRVVLNVVQLLVEAIYPLHV